MDKLKSFQTKDRIAEMLRKEILSGRIEDGQELTQKQLAEILKVSRTPVREALQILELDGLLLRLHNRHVRVIGLNEHTIYENMRVIAAIESEIALILMEKGKLPGELAVQDDRQFHNWLSQQVDNLYLRQVHNRLLKVYPQYVWEICKDSGRLVSQNEEIMLALNNGNSDAVCRSIHKYYSVLAQTLLSHMKEEEHDE